MDSTDRALLNAIQKQFPIIIHPYRSLAEAVGTTEEDAYERIRSLRQEGIIRRLGGVLDSRRLGYFSTLCTAKVPDEKITILARLLEGIPGVTHNYIRNHEYNVWFTLIARSQAVAESILQTIREVSGVADVFSLPATRLFKINVNFDFDLPDEEESEEEELDASEDADLSGLQRKNSTPYDLTNEDIALIQVVQGNLPDSLTPFTDLAELLRWPVEDVISCASRLLKEKVIRRFGAVLRHQKAGFVANAMGVWQVDPEKASAVGETMARFKEVSHCYQRPTLPDWPYNLFTMIHGRTIEDCQDVMNRISLATGISAYTMLFSTAELKKSSMQYFLEDETIRKGGIHLSLVDEKSRQAFAKAQKVIPGGVNSPVRAFKSVGRDPVFIKRGEGAYIWDIDGNRYLDFVGSWGPLIVGHAHPDVVAVIKQVAERGTSYGAPTEVETVLAEEVLKAYPSMEMIRMVNSGTEATMSALRLARGATGRSKIVKFEGCYHGHSDQLLIKAGSGALTFGVPTSPGVTAQTASDTISARFNDLEGLKEIFQREGEEIAGVILEPVAGNMGVVLPEEGFLQGVRRLTEEYGTLLIFDEVMTGFRVSYGGAQGLYGIDPDLTCLGKVIGGGLPVGAYGGKRRFMEQISPSGPIYQAGTLSGNPLAMNAGLVTLKLLQQPGTYEALAGKTTRLAEGLKQISHEVGLPIWVNAVGAMFSAFFTNTKVKDYTTACTSDVQRFADFFKKMLGQGIYLAPSQFEAVFLSTAHTEADINHTLEQARTVLKSL